MRKKELIKKLDELTQGQAVIAKMLEDILIALDTRRERNENQKEVLSNYIDNVAGIMAANGAPPNFIQSFKNLLRQEKTNGRDSTSA